MTVRADDEAVVPETALTCGPGSCPLTLTPAADRTAETTVSVTVADERGGQAEASFVLRVEPLRVTTTGDDGAGSLRVAIAVAEPGDVIGFDTDGLFGTPQTIALFGQLVLDKSLTVEGAGAANLTVSGSNVVRVLKVVDGASVTLRDLTIADGLAPIETIEVGGQSGQIRLGGGAFVGPGSRLTLAAATVRGNEAPREANGNADGVGGGVASFEGTLVLTDCLITDNSARAGGGVANVALGGGEAAMTIDGCTIATNTAQEGGGILNAQGNVLIRGSAIAENAGFIGGGIEIFRGVLVIEPNTVVTANRADSVGGGLFVGGGTLTVTGTSCMIFENLADADEDGVGVGGGIYNDGGDISGVPMARVCDNTPDDIAEP